MSIMTLGFLFLKPYRVAKQIEIKLEMTDENLVFEYRLNNQRKPERFTGKWKDVVGAVIESGDLDLHFKAQGPLRIPSEVWRQPEFQTRLASLSPAEHVLRDLAAPVLET